MYCFEKKIIACKKKRTNHWVKNYKLRLKVHFTRPTENYGHSKTQRNANFKSFASITLNRCIKCVNAGVSDVIVSGIICRCDTDVEKKRHQVNLKLKTMCDINGFHYLCNDNIISTQLWKDGLHLSNGGICKLADNFINMLNNLPNQ